MEPISNTITGIFGARGTGKTAYLLGDESCGIKGLVKTYLAKGMKVLIIDTFDHPSYKSVPTIKPKQLTGKLSGANRIFVRSEQMPELNKIIKETVYNTLLVYEDAYKHQFGKLDKSVMELIGDSKQKNVDILFMYHCFALAPKDLYRYLDYLEIFKTKDTPEERKQEMSGYFGEAMQAYNQVKANPSRYFHKTLYTGL